MKKSQLIGLVGFILLVIACFLPNQSVTLLGNTISYNTFNEPKFGGGTTSSVGIVLIVMGLLAVLTSFLGKGKAWWVNIVGLILFSLPLLGLLFARWSKNSDSSAIGMYLLLVASFILVIANIFGLTTKPKKVVVA